MSACFVSPLSTATTPAELFGSHSHQCSSGIQLPAEVAGLRNSIFAFESRDAGAKSTASSAPATETTPKKSRRHSRRSRLGKRFSTTSTVLAKSTITNPNFSQVNYCIAAILQAQIFDDLYNPDLSVDFPSEFRLETALPAEEGGITLEITDDVLEFETENDEELREKILNLEVPTIDTIYKFISTIFFRANYSVECNILSLIYVTRMTQRKYFALTMDSWRGFWVSSVILAQKVWDDRPVRTSSFALMISGTTTEQLKVLELSGFRLLDFGTRVKPSTYAKYYFELRRLYGEIVGAEAFETWNIAPLGIAEGRRLEYRSSLPGMQYQYDETDQSMKAIPVNSTASTYTASRMAIVSPMTTISHSSRQDGSVASSNKLMEAQLMLSSSVYSTSSSVGSYGGSKRRVKGSSKTTEDIHPISSSARYIIS